MTRLVTSPVWLIGRVSKAIVATVYLGFSWVIARVWIGSLDQESITRTTTSLAPAFVIIGLLAVLVVTSTAVPRQESLDATGLRRRVTVSRTVAPLLALVGVVLLSTAMGRMAGSTWHIDPLLAGGLNLAAITFILTCLVPPGWAGLLASAYTFVCFFSANSLTWWNLLLRDVEPTDVARSFVVFGAASLFYLATGSRPAHLYEVV